MPERTQPVVPLLPADELHQLSRQICQAVSDLQQVNPCYGWCRLLIPLALAAFGGVVYWQSDQWIVALGGLLLLGLAESALLITTHEALHRTLLARPKWERVLSCWISWPMAFPSCTYGVIHLWHHRWNSLDFRDPERVKPCKRPWLTWALGAGGVGVIVSTVYQGWLLRQNDSRLLWRLGYDAAGIVFVHGMILWWVIAHDVLLRYLLSWFVVERITGGIMQTRALVEHWSLWQPRQNFLLSQLYGSRNIAAGHWLNTVMGGLPHHSAHHAFPSIPFHHLPEASSRIAAVLRSHGLPPLPQCQGYLKAFQQLSSGSEHSL